MSGKAVFYGALTLLLPVIAQAQSPFIFVGGGVTIPTGLYKSDDGAKTGWMATGGVGFPVGGKGLEIGAEGYFGSNKHSPPPAGDKTNLYGASGWAAWRFGKPAKPGVYLLGSAGALKHDFRSTTVPAANGGNFEFAWSAGAGVDIPFGGSKSIYVESRYMARGDTKFIPIFVGLSIGVGKSSGN